MQTGGYAAAVYEVMGWEAQTFLTDWDEVVKVQNQATLDGSPVAQTIIKFMDDKDEYVGTSSELHKKLEGVAESLGVSVVRDKAWPKSARWLWRRTKEVLPLLVAAGIEASREHTDKGTAIRLRKVPRNNVSDVREDESGGGKAKTADNSAGVMSSSIVRSSSNVSPNPAKTKGYDNTDITDDRYGNLSQEIPEKENRMASLNSGSAWENDPMRFYRQ